jgi:prepilin-type N-terminal cleavage/methylation domain-containing protein/prepilin-type processing-associated H-X9-DG protein
MQKTSIEKRIAGEPARSGFTLIELLVVIAIIGILAAILFPVFARARENARRASCQSNLKQICLGVFQYTQDYDERFPQNGGPAPCTTYSGGFPQSWATTLQPYMKSTQVFVCPSDARNGTTASYGDNMLIGGYGNSGSTIQVFAINQSQLQAPAITILLFESSAAGYNTIACHDFTNGFYNDVEYARHLEGSNWAFADGHVKWLKLSQTNSAALQKGVSWNLDGS